MTTNEAITVARAMAKHWSFTERAKEAIKVLVAIAEHEHARRTRKRKERKQRAMERNARNDVCGNDERVAGGEDRQEG